MTLRAVTAGGDQAFTNIDVASGGAVEVYNTTPISSTDYERVKLDWATNAARLWTQSDGTGAWRTLRIGTASSDGATGPNLYQNFGVVTPFFATTTTSNAVNTGIWNELAAFSGMIASSGTQTAVGISPVYAQTSTAAAVALLVNPSGTFGSGGGVLQSWQLAGAARASIDSQGVFKQAALTVGTLPAAATAGAGARSFVTDANATTFASIVAAGGANGVPVYSDGTNWRIG